MRSRRSCALLAAGLLTAGLLIGTWKGGLVRGLVTPAVRPGAHYSSFQMLWRADPQVTGAVSGGPDLAAYSLTPDGILAVGSHTMTLYDLRTGQIRWRNTYSSKRFAVAWAATGGAIVATFWKPDQALAEDRPQSYTTVGLSNATGRALWTANGLTLTTLPGTLTGNPTGLLPNTADRLAAGDGTVMTPGLAGQLLGYSAATGRIRWIRRLPPGCQLEQYGNQDAADDVVAVFALSCASYSEIAGYDPADGNLLWQSVLRGMNVGDELRASAGAEVAVSDGVTSVSDGYTMEVLDRHGNVLLWQHAPLSACTPACPISVTGNKVLVSYALVSRTSAAFYLQSIDLKTRKTLWRKPEPTPAGLADTVGDSGFYQDLAAGSNVSYGLQNINFPYNPYAFGLGTTGIPIALDTINPSSGTFRSQVLPVTNDGWSWLAISKGILYVGYLTGSASPLIAFRTTNSYAHAGINPAPAAHWPDPCRLIPRAEIETERPKTTYQADPLISVLNNHVTQVRSGCSYQLTNSDQIFIVQVEWVTSTTQAAAELYTDMQQNVPTKPLPGTQGDARYDYEPGSNPNTAFVRVGPVIASVLILNQSFSLYKLTRALTAGLQRAAR